MSTLFIAFLFSSEPSSSVFYGKYEGIIHPPAQEYIVSLLNIAQQNDAELVVLMLDTPGGLDASMREIIKKILNSSVPVVVFVYPPGGRAASAGVFITLSAHIAAMAPGTNIGAAHPVTMGGGEADSVMMKKIENDAVAYLKSIAKKRNRNEQFAEESIRKSISITAEKAVEENVVDLLAENLGDLLDKIDGRKVIIGEDTVKLQTSNYVLKEYKMGLRNKVLAIVSNPTIAYLLLVLGFYGLFFEITNPGAIFPGVAGAIFLILGLYALQTLPVNFAGVLLILLSMLLFLLEIKIQSHGALGAGGAISLFLGSLFLFSSDIPYLRIDWWAIILVTALTTFFFLFVIAKVVQVHRAKPFSGREGLIDEVGEARSDITNKKGVVWVHGEFWKAVSEKKIKKGEQVRVVGFEGTKIKVSPIE